MTSIRHAIDHSPTTHVTVDAQGAKYVAATRVAEHVCVSPGSAIKSACARSEVRLIHPRLSTQLVCQGLCLCARLWIETLGSLTLAMKLLFFSKQFKYDRFEQIRTLRPNATIP